MSNQHLTLILGTDQQAKRDLAKQLKLDWTENDFTTAFRRGKYLLMDGHDQLNLKLLTQLNPAKIVVLNHQLDRPLKALLGLKLETAILLESGNYVADELTTSLSNLDQAVNYILEWLTTPLNYEHYTTFIMGRSNGGKSTIFNQVIGHEIATIKDEYKTTQNKIEFLLPADQLGCIDSVGLMRSIKNTEQWKRMANTALAADLTCVVIGVDHFYEVINFKCIEFLIKNYKPFFIVINKIDTVTLDELSVMQKYLVNRYGLGNITILKRELNSSSRFVNAFIKTALEIVGEFNHIYTRKELMALKSELGYVVSQIKTRHPVFAVFTSSKLKLIEIKHLQKKITKLLNIRHTRPKVVIKLKRN